MRTFGVMLLCSALAACASKGNWQHNHISSGSAEFSSSRLSFTPPNSYNQIQLEILRTKEASRGYLYVHSLPFSSYQDDKKIAPISILIGEETLFFLAKRHEGGHRVLLSEEILHKILQALETGYEVTLSTPGYKTTLNPDGFASQYKKFQGEHFYVNILN